MRKEDERSTGYDSESHLHIIQIQWHQGVSFEYISLCEAENTDSFQIVARYRFSSSGSFY